MQSDRLGLGLLQLQRPFAAGFLGVRVPTSFSLGLRPLTHWTSFMEIINTSETKTFVFIIYFSLRISSEMFKGTLTKSEFAKVTFQNKMHQLGQQRSRVF